VSIELRISSISLSLNVLVYAHVNVGVFTRTPFSCSAWWIQLFDGALVDAWLYFPGLKVGNIHLFSFFLKIWWR
jgi:hypothetical protein